MRALAILITIIWIGASITYALHGYRVKKEAVTKMEDEREGRYVPEVVKAQPVLPKSLEERLLALAEQEGTVPLDSTGDDVAAGHDPPPAPSGAIAPLGEVAQPTARPSPPPPPPPIGAEPSAMMSIFDAPAPPPARQSSADATTVAEALSGIELPCDLVPLVAAGSTAIDPHRVPFITRGIIPTTIAVSVRDALVGAGYEFRSTGPMTAMAVRAPITLMVDVHDAPSTVLDGTVKRFPSATLDSVVVEITSC